MQTLTDKHIVVVGLGTTGQAVSRFLNKRGANVTATDTATEADLGDGPARLRSMGITLELGGHSDATFDHADLIIVSPGVPGTMTPLTAARKRGIPVIGEIELAFRFIREPIIAVTGTNGKTTTATLLGKILEYSGLKTFVGGNIGTPLIDYVDRSQAANVIVLEISSFQLDTIDTFRPKVAVLLNITPDHLDRYTGFDAYARSKSRIFLNQRVSDFAVLNGSDPGIRAIATEIKSQKWFYTEMSEKEGESGPGAEIGRSRIRLRHPDGRASELDLSAGGLIGNHNRQNTAAAALAALAVGVTPDAIQPVLSGFTGLSHRLETVVTRNGVRYVNDSKATNIDAVASALDAFELPVILIMGGRDKGGDYRILRTTVSRHVRQLIVMGEAANLIADALGDIVETRPATSLEAAVSTAKETAASGEIVLLSPGCSSFDMFTNYAQRGDRFRELANELS